MRIDERINRILQKIEQYRSRKQNNIFDDFYHEDLDLMIEGLEMLRQGADYGDRILHGDEAANKDTPAKESESPEW